MAQAANFTVVVNGTASHSIPQSLCGLLSHSCVKSTLLMIIFPFRWIHVRGMNSQISTDQQYSKFNVLFEKDINVSNQSIL